MCPNHRTSNNSVKGGKGREVKAFGAHWVLTYIRALHPHKSQEEEPSLV
jgi:hypothetical protein